MLSPSSIGTPLFFLNKRTIYPQTKNIKGTMKEMTATIANISTLKEVFGALSAGGAGGAGGGTGGGGGVGSAGGGSGVGGKSFPCHALGGPSVLPLPSFLSNLACHAVAARNISSEDNSELVSQLVISTSNKEARSNILSMLST